MTTGTAGSGAARLALPDFPWDLLAPHKATAAAHHDGIVLDHDIDAPHLGEGAGVVDQVADHDRQHARRRERKTRAEGYS